MNFILNYIDNIRHMSVFVKHAANLIHGYHRSCQKLSNIGWETQDNFNCDQNLRNGT